MKRNSREQNIWRLAIEWNDSVAEAKRATAHLTDSEIEQWVSDQIDDRLNKAH